MPLNLRNPKDKKEHSISLRLTTQQMKFIESFGKEESGELGYAFAAAHDNMLESFFNESEKRERVEVLNVQINSLNDEIDRLNKTIENKTKIIGCSMKNFKNTVKQLKKILNELSAMENTYTNIE